MGTTLRNDFEGCTNGTNVVNTVTGGTNFGAVLVNNSSVGGSGGSANLTYTNSSPIRGSISVTTTPQAATGYMRMDYTETGIRYVAGVTFTLAGTRSAVASTGFPIAFYSSGPTLLGSAGITSAGKIQMYLVSTGITATASTTTLAAGTYTVEAFYQLESVAAAGDGQLGYILYDSGGSQLDTQTATARSTGTANAISVRFGIPATTLGFTGVKYDDMRINQLNSGWIGLPKTGTAAFTVANVTTAAGARTPKGTAAFSNSVVTTAAGKRVAGGIAAFTVSNVWTAAGKRVAGGTAAFGVGNVWTAAGKRTPKGAAAFNNAVAWTATGSAPSVDVHSGTAAFVVANAFSAAGKFTAQGAATFTVDNELTAAGVTPDEPTAPRPHGPLTLTGTVTARTLTGAVTTRALAGSITTRTLTVED